MNSNVPSSMLTPKPADKDIPETPNTNQPTNSATCCCDGGCGGHDKQDAPDEHSGDHAAHGQAHEHAGHPHKHQHEHEHSHAHAEHAHAHAESGGCGCHDSCSAPIPLTDKQAPKSTIPRGHRLRVPDMDCAVEANEIRGIVEPVEGIRDIQFDFSRRLLIIDAEASAAQAAFDRIRRSGFRTEEVPDEQVTSATGNSADDDHADNSPGIYRLLAALALAVVAELLHYFTNDAQGWFWQAAGMVISVGAIALAGFEVYRKGLVALLHKRLNINALMTVAVTGAVLIGQWPEAAMVMALYAIAELIEARAANRARGAIRDLLDTGPQQALVQQADGSWLAQETSTVAVGTVIRSRPGERIALDGVILDGSSTVNQAPITGESLPVDKVQGDTVFAGSINETATLDIQVSSATGHNLIDRIIAAVEEAQQSRAPTQRFVDRFARIYTPAVFVIALATALILPMMGWSWLDAIYKALVLLVIACPCALVISTPVTVVSGLTVAARRGILIKGGTYLENLRKLRAVALDKTGTLTEGKPKLVAWQAVSAQGIPLGEAEAGTAQATARASAIAHALAAQSSHPVSMAIAAGLEDSAVQVQAFQALAGRGSMATVDGQTYHLGNHRLIEELKVCSPALEALLAEHERQGRTVTLLAGPQGVMALFAVADSIKPTSREAIASLKALGVVPVMLSGDNQTTASTVAAEAGIEDARGDLLPTHKQDAIIALQKQYGPTAMTGDGLNDAPALAQADIGMAMGGAGTDTAIETADVVLMNDDLRHIPAAIRLSRDTHAVLWQNITLALGIKAVFFVLAIAGDASMWMAVFADMGASLLVVANGLRLLGKLPKQSR